MSSEIERYVKKTLPDVLDKVLPDMIDDALRESFAKNPAKQLNSKGFTWAWVLRIEHHWPDVDRHEAAKWMLDYLPDKVGHPDYDWSASAAYELADEYVKEFGE